MRIQTVVTILLLVSLVGACLLPASAHAVNYGAGARSSPGYHFRLYPYYYCADTRSDKAGNPTLQDLGLRKYGVYVSSDYYVGDLHLNVIIPVGAIEVGKLKSDDAGLGDIQLRAGWFLPVEWVTVQPVLLVKAPTGGFDKQYPVNFGDGQTDLVMELYLYKLMAPFAFDAVFKYVVRFRNPESDFTPGNEFVAEGLATVRLAEKIRIGPAINFITGADNKQGGKTLADSGLLRLAVGGEIVYGRLEHLKISLAAYQDLLTRNSTEGILVVSRLSFVF